MGVAPRNAGGTMKRVIVYSNTNMPGVQSVDIDVKTALPQVYKRLTVENFGVLYAGVYVYSNVLDEGVRVNSYDPASGTLQVVSSRFGSGTASTTKFFRLEVACWYR